MRMNPFNIILNKNEFCCLCYKTIADEEETTHFRDKVLLDIDNCLRTELLYDILSCVLSPEFLKTVPKSELLCVECTRSATNSYAFIETCKKSVMNLNNVIDNLARSVEGTVENIHDYKSLFLSIGTGAKTSRQFYDTSSSSTLTAALEQFNRLYRSEETLSNTKPKQSKAKSDSTRGLPNGKTCASTKKTNRIIRLKNETYSLIRTVDGFIRYQCKFCFQVFSEINDLEDHECINCEAQVAEPVVSLNSESSALVCCHCGKTCTSKFSLVVHELSHIRKLVCPNSECKRMYSNRTKYLQHIENNTCRYGKLEKDKRSPKVFQCLTCKKMYATKDSLKKHVRRAHDTTYQKLVCKWCGKRFTWQCTLQSHIIKHTKEKNIKCEHCGRAFASRKYLLNHSFLHTGEKPYECKLCGMKFVHPDSLTRHVRQHFEPKYECNLCPKKFTTKCALKKHKNRHSNPTSKLFTKGLDTLKAGQKQTGAGA